MRISNIKLLFIVLFFVSLSLCRFATHTYALTPTQTPAPTTLPTSEKAADSMVNQINNLKDRIASRVAELKLVEKRGVIGTVTDVSSTQLTLNDVAGNIQFIDVDEITKFSPTSSKEDFGISDITKGSKISVLGLYNKSSRRTLARFIDSYTLPVFLSAEVTNVDRTNNTITVATPDKKETIVDIEVVTKITSYSKDDGQVKSGFSKVISGDKTYIVGYPDKKEKNRMSSTRIIVFPSATSTVEPTYAPQSTSPTP